ncbi:MAG: family 78 glycoside hydrolase catalytic domain [Lachnospiraceae bacterium]|nr:family 78 glycoside hydrolase catalytic domain [Lachnospiraceae bacterium]
MIKAVNLKSAYLTNPVGIDLIPVTLSWTVQNANKQTAYQLRYSKNDAAWEELPVMQSSSMHTIFDLPLCSRDRIAWQVRLTDQDGVVGLWSEDASFEMGLLSKNDWKARWIMGNYDHSKSGKVRYPADCFRKEFEIAGQVTRARLYITACGIYEARINGKKVGDQVFTPGSTAFQKRVHYQTYDVTDLLSARNVWHIDLSDGYYASDMGVFNKHKPFGYEPKVLAQLEIVKEDGSVQTLITDPGFAWSNDGPVRFADMKNGEIVDFSLTPSYSGFARETSYEGIVCCSNSNPIHEKERFDLPEVLHTPDGHTVLDFGQNLAGYVEVKLTGAAGKTCEMVFGEKLDNAGNFTVKNISYHGEYTDSRFQKITLTCDAESHTYKPRFTVMGFQYVLLLDWSEEVRAENFTAIAVYSDMDTTFAFESSDAGINQIVKNTFWSVKGNFLDVPTDCPTRERAGWTGDAQLFFNTGNYMMDQRAFFRKWMRDVADGQKANGLVYNINPSAPSGNGFIEWVSMEGSAGWGDAMITIPYYYWKRYGDDVLLREFWTPMERCLAFFESRMGKRNLFSLKSPERSPYDKYLVASGRHFGEWTEPDDCAPGKSSLVLPAAEEATAYLSYAARLMAEMASYLGKSADATRYQEIADRTKEAYNYYFVKNGDVTSNRMCKYVRPCGLDLAEGTAREKLLEKIVTLNRERNYKIGTGFLTTPFVFEMLSEAGASDDAYRTLTNPELGWMQQIHQGATTVWENWTPDASLNHYSKGACCQWLFDCVCGVKLDGRENHFIIEPHPVSQIDHISFTYTSVYGTVASAWEHVDGNVLYHITVPAGCSAQVKLPGREPVTLFAGSYDL